MMKNLRENPLVTRRDLRQSLVDMLSPLKDFVMPGGYLAGSTLARHSPKVSLLEAWSRTLWGIAPLVSGGGEYLDIDLTLSILRQGVDPGNPGYWGPAVDNDQRLVEMAAVGLALILDKKTFWDSLDAETQTRLYDWLSQIEERGLPACNWHFFRVLVCEGFRALSLPVNEKSENESLEILDSYYQEEGWYRDGPGGAFDMYNPFAFHFYGLVYAKTAGSRDPLRAERFLERARLFGQSFASWFREDGSVIPYGRSLTYRFAAASFFSACAFAGLEVLPWGVMKGIVLRHLRWWFSRPILDAGGILSIGYGYPNLIMADNYNAPGSPYWALKTYLVLALGDDHPFWRAQELPLPEQPECIVQKKPGFIISHTREDAQLLTAGFPPPFAMNHEAQKYGKFAYSARFGFCVSLGGQRLEDAGCDSTLLLADMDAAMGANVVYWRERRGAEQIQSGENWVSSVWRPWPDVEILTTLYCLGAWHVRVHRIQSARRLKAVEGGFGIKRSNEQGDFLPEQNTAAAKREALIAFPWAASRIIALEKNSPRTGNLVLPLPNLNILEPSCAVPVLEGELERGLTVWITAVRAGDTEAVTAEAPPEIHVS